MENSANPQNINDTVTLDDEHDDHDADEVIIFVRCLGV